MQKLAFCTSLQAHAEAHILCVPIGMSENVGSMYESLVHGTMRSACLPWGMLRLACSTCSWGGMEALPPSMHMLALTKVSIPRVSAEVCNSRALIDDNTTYLLIGDNASFLLTDDNASSLSTVTQ